MKRSIVFPFFVETSLLLFIFMLVVHLVSLGEQGTFTNQKGKSALKVPQTQELTIELHRSSTP
jgi:hypothetical protein